MQNGKDGNDDNASFAGSRASTVKVSNVQTVTPKNTTATTMSSQASGDVSDEASAEVNYQRVETALHSLNAFLLLPQVKNRSSVQSTLHLLLHSIHGGASAEIWVGRIRRGFRRPFEFDDFLQQHGNLLEQVNEAVTNLTWDEMLVLSLRLQQGVLTVPVDPTASQPIGI